MLPPDAQRLAHIRDYCLEIRKPIERYGKSFETFDSDPDYQRLRVLLHFTDRRVEWKTLR